MSQKKEAMSFKWLVAWHFICCPIKLFYVVRSITYNWHTLYFVSHLITCLLRSVRFKYSSLL